MDEAIEYFENKEGWEKVGTTPSASWAAATIGQDFEIQMQFMCQADN